MISMANTIVSDVRKDWISVSARFATKHRRIDGYQMLQEVAMLRERSITVTTHGVKGFVTIKTSTYVLF